MPHEGDIYQANLVQHGYNFNEPLIVMSAANKGTDLTTTYLTCDN